MHKATQALLNRLAVPPGPDSSNEVADLIRSWRKAGCPDASRWALGPAAGIWFRVDGLRVVFEAGDDGPVDCAFVIRVQCKTGFVRVGEYFDNPEDAMAAADAMFGIGFFGPREG